MRTKRELMRCNSPQSSFVEEQALENNSRLVRRIRKEAPYQIWEQSLLVELHSPLMQARSAHNNWWRKRYAQRSGRWIWKRCNIWMEVLWIPLGSQFITSMEAPSLLVLCPSAISSGQWSIFMLASQQLYNPNRLPVPIKTTRLLETRERNALCLKCRLETCFEMHTLKAPLKSPCLLGGISYNTIHFCSVSLPVFFWNDSCYVWEETLLYPFSLPTHFQSKYVALAYWNNSLSMLYSRYSLTTLPSHPIIHHEKRGVSPIHSIGNQLTLD